MSHALLGGSFDIHGGGIDLMFPHHENEIAQSACAHPGEDFARVWMHNGFLQVEGEKMSKSLGNFFTVRDLLDRGVPGEVIRFVLLSTHYRQPLDWNRRIAHEADRSVGKLAGMLGARGVTSLECLTAGQPIGEVVAALGDDLNTRKALDALQPAAVRESLREEDEDYLARIYASQLLLGFDLRDHPEARVAAERHDVLIGIIQTQSGDLLRAKALAAKLDAARRAKNFPEADRLRKVLMEAGLEVRTGPEGTMVLPLSGFDPGKLEAPS
jgi:cysteinyl-tRNA synthetase